MDGRRLLERVVATLGVLGLIAALPFYVSSGLVAPLWAIVVLQFTATVAMLFLPAMRVGGMQFFRSEGFDTMGKALPRAGDIAAELTLIYIGLTAACVVAYLAFGMNGFDASMRSRPSRPGVSRTTTQASARICAGRSIRPACSWCWPRCRSCG